MSKLNLKNFIKQYGSKKVFYDPSFQRRSVWDKKDWNSFASSLVKGWATNPIIVLNVEDCREHCHKIGDRISEEYYNNVLSRGYKYISLDGQNRSRSIEKFLTDEITISGEFVDADEELQKIDNKFFKDCPTRLKDKFRTGIQIQVVEFTEVTKSDAGKIFKAINDGKPLNDQEKRNSNPSPIAQFVRDCSEDFKPLSEKILKKDKITRMLDDEQIAKTLMVLLRKYNDPDIEMFKNPSNIGLSCPEIDSFYTLGNDVFELSDPSCPYIDTELTRAKEIIESTSLVLLQQEEFPKAIKLKHYWGVIFLTEYLYDNGYEIFKPVEFMKAFVALEHKLEVDSENAYGKARQQMMSQGKDPDNISKESYYFRWSSLPHQAPKRKLRKENLVEAFKKSNFKQFGVRQKPLQQDLPLSKAA